MQPVQTEKVGDDKRDWTVKVDRSTGGTSTTGGRCNRGKRSLALISRGPTRSNQPALFMV